MKYLASLSLLLLITIVSCKKKSTPDTYQVSAPIVMDLHQSLQPNGASASLFIGCATGNYPTLNYSLNYKMTRDGNNISVTFTDITNPGFGLDQFGPATAGIVLGELNNGSYPLVFNVGRIQYKVQLVVSDTNYSITGAANGFMSFKRTGLNKVPVNTIWGHILTSTARATSADSVINALVSDGALPYSGRVGYYEHYSIYPGMVIDSGYGAPGTRNFIYHYTGSYADIDSLVKKYRFTEYKDLMIEIYTSDGSFYLSGQH